MSIKVIFYLHVCIIGKVTIVLLLNIMLNRSFVFGDVIPKLNKNIYSIIDITPRNIWMESNYIFNQIRSLRPNEQFHSIECYTLKWQPPNSPFRLSIPLIDVQFQEMLINQMEEINALKKKTENILFYFSTKDPTLSLFSLKVHPSSLLSYRSKVVVLEKLCGFFMIGKLPLKELQDLLSADFVVWKSGLYNLLPHDEQEFHLYLLDKPPPIMTLKKLEKKYLNNDISLEGYNDFKFLERKDLKDTENLAYPRPYNTDDCVVCLKINIATIHCPQCSHMVCKHCVETYFLDEKTKIGSFIYLHRFFCLKKVYIKPNECNICNEQGYLVDIRNNNRIAHLQEYIKSAELREQLENNEDDGDEEEDVEVEFNDEEYGEDMSDEIEVVESIHEFPEELKEIIESLNKINKKYMKLKAFILNLEMDMNVKGHTSQFMKRLAGNKSKHITDLRSLVKSKLDIFDARLGKIIDVEILFLDEILNVKQTIIDMNNDINDLCDSNFIAEKN